MCWAEKFITALDSDQIQNIPNIDLQVFKNLSSETALELVPKLPGFNKFDSLLYYTELPNKDKKRYVLAINPDKFIPVWKTWPCGAKSEFSRLCLLNDSYGDLCTTCSKSPLHAILSGVPFMIRKKYRCVIMV